MARKVDTIVHAESGIEVPIRLDVKTLTFEAKFGNERFQSKDGEKVRALVLAAIAKSHALTWVPVLAVEVICPFYRGGCYEFEVRLDRFYIAQRDKCVVKLAWQAYEDGHTDRFKTTWQFENAEDLPKQSIPVGFPNLAGYSRNRAKFFYPYTEEAWERIQKLQDLMSALQTDFVTALTAGLDVTDRFIDALIKVCPEEPEE
jgi:hypothetical protein